MTTGRRLEFRLACAVIGALALATNARAQELGGAGTVQGTVKDPTGAVMQAVDVRIANAVPGYSRTATTDAAGKFVFRNLPPNPYHITVSAQGFRSVERDVDVRSGVPITIDLSLAVAAATETVEVRGHAEDLLERDPSAHVDIDLTAGGYALESGCANRLMVPTYPITVRIAHSCEIA